ncbi:MAG: hypothetical protein ABI549_02020 [Flavobacterium sp.]|uniref:hypothetical protein n=1 Tax=Flavobacterium sp. TaxID=239 RepID=UPI0032633F15
MKNIIFLSVLLLTVTTETYSQSKTISKSIISSSAAVKKFYEKSELESLQKGELIDLYLERIQVIVEKLPYIALTTRRGVTINDIGIPDTIENSKLLDKQKQTIKTFLTDTEDFEKNLTPFADKSDIIDAILFYETILKELRMIRE